MTVSLIGNVQASLIAGQLLFAAAVTEFLEEARAGTGDYKEQECRECIALLCERVEDPALVLALRYFKPEGAVTWRGMKSLLENMTAGTGQIYTLDQYLEVIAILHEHLERQLEVENSSFAVRNRQCRVVLSEGVHYRLAVYEWK